jgi:Conserved protein containing a Zn-ribbon-like motif, possibly RNA-binding
VEFENVSGNLALDLVGTLWWRRDRPRDLLATPSDATAWAASVGVTLNTASDESSLEALLALRELVYRECARWFSEQVPALAPLALGPSGTTELIAIARSAPTWPELDDAGQLRQVGDPSALRSTVARSALDLFHHTDTLTVRECGSQRCTRLFIDRSRGKRVWCGMSTCGNREKAARWRARHDTLGPAHSG